MLNLGPTKNKKNPPNNQIEWRNIRCKSVPVDGVDAELLRPSMTQAPVSTLKSKSGTLAGAKATRVGKNYVSSEGVYCSVMAYDMELCLCRYSPSLSLSLCSYQSLTISLSLQLSFSHNLSLPGNMVIRGIGHALI